MRVLSQQLFWVPLVTAATERHLPPLRELCMAQLKLSFRTNRAI